jgi:hypothetical protein
VIDCCDSIIVSVIGIEVSTTDVEPPSKRPTAKATAASDVAANFAHDRAGLSAVMASNFGHISGSASHCRSKAPL